MKPWTENELSEANKILNDINEENSIALEKLKQKCRWEHVSRLGVILQWGDPRQWK